MVAAIQHWCQVQRMSGAAGATSSLWKIVVAPNLSLKSGIHLANVVQCRKDTQPRSRRAIKVFPAGGVRQSLPDDGLSQQCLKARGHICQMVLQQVDAVGVIAVRLPQNCFA